MAVALLCVGCFSPNQTLEPDTTDTGSSTTGTGVTGEQTSGAPATTAGPTDSSTGTSPTTTQTATTSDATTTDDPNDTSSGGSEPVCGDGVVDPDEDCDDGRDSNGLDQSCLPDCTLNVCGDGNLGPDEFCDDGEEGNVLAVGACAPDCSRVIEERLITPSVGFAGGNLLPNPTAAADAACEPGFTALFAVPGVRQATNGTPNTADDQIDWPLEPYTAYLGGGGELVWITDHEPLLGVRKGKTLPLLAPIAACDPSPCGTQNEFATGLNNDWTNAMSNTCNGWSTISDAASFRAGNPEGVSSFLSAGLAPCNLGLEGGGQERLSFYCVEQ